MSISVIWTMTPRGESLDWPQRAAQRPHLAHPADGMAGARPALRPECALQSEAVAE